MKSLKNWLDFHRDAMQKSMAMAEQNWRATCMTIFTIVTMLVLSSIFWMLTDVMRGVAVDWQSNKQMTIYLKVPSTVGEQSQLLAKVAGTPGVEQVNLKTAEDGLRMLQDNLEMRDILSYLPENPLPAAIEVIPNQEINTSEKLAELRDTLQAYPNVTAVRLDLDSVNRIALFIAVVANILKVLIGLISFALVLIIANSLRLVIGDRVDEITVLKFVGASYRYIRRPYLYTGCLYGLLAALLTIICINVFLFGMQTRVNDLLSAYAISYEAGNLSVRDSCLLIAVSLGVGWLGARIATRKYLHLSTYLYK